MTDRIHSCRHASDGRHAYDRQSVDGHVAHTARCVHCGRRKSERATPPPAIGWNVPADDPDAHLGGVGGE